MFSLREHKEIHLDTPEATLEHREILLRKPFLRRLYENWYHEIIKIGKKTPEGAIVEVGSGGGFLKNLYPEVITSDIQYFEHCDMTFACEDLPFGDNEISALVMQNVFHHIPDAEKFFQQASRVLKPGGKIVMIEPANTWFARFIYDKIHHEPWNADSDWKFPSNGPLSGANGALPWIIFTRDSDKFQKLFPTLSHSKPKLHTPFRYILTGGFSYKSFVQGWSFGVISLIEKIFFPFYPVLAMFQTIEVTKTTDGE